MTLAPELPGALDAIRLVVDAGAAAAVGHTGADCDGHARPPSTPGATILTHAFNAMPGLHHRDPGPVAAAASDPRVILEVIADGVHLHPEVVAHRVRRGAGPGRARHRRDGGGRHSRRPLRPRRARRRGRRRRGPAAAGRRDRRLDADTGCALCRCAVAAPEVPARSRRWRRLDRRARRAPIGRGDDLGHGCSGAAFAADAVLLSSAPRGARASWTRGRRRTSSVSSRRRHGVRHRWIGARDRLSECVFPRNGSRRPDRDLNKRHRHQRRLRRSSHRSETR